MKISAVFCCCCAFLASQRALAQVDAPTPASRNPVAHVLLGPAQDAQFAPLRAADDERIAAMIAADPARLDAILSDDLHYAHSNSVIDYKAAFIESLTSRRIIYKSFEYTRYRFTGIGPGIVLMSGRALARVESEAGERLLDLNFLAVWREERGRWRFLAWQSSRNPPPNPATTAK